MYAKRYDVGGMAHTLDPDEVCKNHGEQVGWHTRIHADGWKITGCIGEDYYYWVNDFEAFHPVFGRVWGDFEEEVFADSELGLDVFVASHGPRLWDYWDI